MAFTFFCRDGNTLEIIEQIVIPALKTRRYFDIWDAGCATGQEPYTLAMMLRDHLGEFGFRNVRIHASDINPQFDKIIADGIYPDEQVKRIPEKWINSYFNKIDDNTYQIIPAIRKSVIFYHHDLTSLTPVKTEVGLVVCKNVLLHLSLENRIKVIEMFHAAMSPSAFFATENTQKMPPACEKLFTPVVSDGPVFRKN